MSDVQWDWLSTVLGLDRPSDANGSVGMGQEAILKPGAVLKHNDTVVLDKAASGGSATTPPTAPPTASPTASPPVSASGPGAGTGPGGGASGRVPPSGPVAASPEELKAAQAAADIVARYNKLTVTFEMEAASGAFFKVYKPFEAFRTGKEFAKALGLVPEIEKQLAEMEAIGAELPKKKKAADEEAAKVIAMDDAAVKKMSAADKADAVRALLAAGAPTGDARKAQIKIYKNTDLDPAFMKQDEARGDAIASELKGDKELKEARTGWKTSSEADKIKVLEKIVAVQSKQFGIDPPKIVIEHSPSVVSGDGSTLTTNGYFDPGDGMLHINMDPDSNVHTFQTAVDLALHENAHNWQSHLVKDLQSGKLKSSDPNYAQALMFAVNELNPGGYVDGSEDMAAYQKQPFEDHSWTTGPETAKKIIKGL